MSLQNLRAFTEVYRCGSISEAARNLGLTQPAVSQQIASLETQIGRSLFLRQPRGVVPTAFANDLASRLGDALDRAEDALATMRARSSDLSGVVHIAGPAELMAERIAPRIKTLQGSGLDVRIHLGGKASLYEMLLGGEVDMAFTASTPDDHRLAAARVGSERLVAVAAPDLARKINGAADLPTALRDAPLLSYDVERPLVRDWCACNNLDLGSGLPAITAPDIRLLRRLVELGAGWSVIPDYLCNAALETGRMDWINAPIAEPDNAFHLVWAKSALRHPRVAYARRILLEDEW